MTFLSRVLRNSDSTVCRSPCKPRVALAGIILLITASFLLACGRAKTDAEVNALKRQVAELQSKVSAKPTGTPELTAKTTLSGTIFYRKMSGDSLVVPASRVYLVRSFDAESIDKFMALEAPLLDLEWRTAFLDDGERFFHSFDDTLRRLQTEAAIAAGKATIDSEGKYGFQATTNVDGRYLFTVPPGKYQLFAELDSADAKGFWYIDVDVAGQQELDLDNSNLTKIYDRTADSAGKVNTAPKTHRPLEEEPDYITHLKDWHP